jgi:ATP-binding cassette subfamily B protein
VLRDFDPHVRPGETVALVGRTEPGKSTAARLLDRFYDPDAGRILVDGHDLRDLTMASLRSQVGIVLDEPFLFSVSIRDNIAYGRPGASGEEVTAAARAAAGRPCRRTRPAPRGDVRDEYVAVAGAGLHVVVYLAGHGGGGAYE